MSPEQAGASAISTHAATSTPSARDLRDARGRAACDRPHAQAMLAKLMTERPTSLRSSPRRRAECARRHRDARARKAPTDRFPSAREFGDALARVGGAGDSRRYRARGIAGDVALAVVGAVVLGVVGAYLAGAIDGSRRSSVSGDAPAVIRSIAVLPLDNYSGDPTQDYFAEGMTDELTADLATISQLRVISRGSAMQFKGKHRPPTPEIARSSTSMRSSKARCRDPATRCASRPS